MTIRARLRRLEQTADRRRAPPTEQREELPFDVYRAFVALIPETGDVPAEPPPGLDPRLGDLWPYAETLRGFARCQGGELSPGVCRA
jgi:hypothetical protein